ncbi:MAG: glycosyl hydrolase, partial [Verrucomicrobiota bacterium]
MSSSLAPMILSQMTLEEKASLLAGVDDWHIRGIPRLEIPSIRVTDCGHGVTLCGDRSSPATCFPTAIGMASTWNEALIEKAGSVIG